MVTCSESLKGRKMKRILITVLACTVLINMTSGTEAAAQKKAIQVGDIMPGFFLKDISGNDFFAKDYIGAEAKASHKAIIFSLSASYCKPCKKEIPELGRMIEKYYDKGLGVYIIAVESKDKAEELVSETKTTLPVLIDRYLLVPKLIGREGIPCTLLVDGDGIVRFINTGFNEDNADEFIARFENAVADILGADTDSDE